MKFHIEVIVRKKPGVLDPEGNIITSALGRLGHKDISAVRVSKLFDLFINSDDRDTAIRIAETVASDILANPIIEDYFIGTIEEK